MPIIEAQTFSAEVLARFDKELAKYPADQKQSAVIACLSIVQQVHGHVSPEGEKGVAQYLGMPVMAVHEVSTFYNMFNLKSVGRFKINVCTNLPCQLREGQSTLHYLEKKQSVPIRMLRYAQCFQVHKR